MTTMRISELARRSGVPASTLGYYGDVGLLPAARTVAGYRIFDERAHQRLMFIEAAKRLRLPLQSIGDLLTIWESDACRSVKQQLRPAIEERIEKAEAAVADLEQLRRQLIDARARLDDLPDRDEACDPQCAFLLSEHPSVRANEQHTGSDTHTCTLQSPDYRKRVDHWREVLGSSVRGPVRGGVEIRLDIGRASTLVELVAAEQSCCGFLEFSLRFAAQTLVVTITGPPEAQSIISDLTTDTTPRTHE